MHNRVHCAQNNFPALKSYILVINTSNFTKKHYENILTKELNNELHAWIENHPHVINDPNIKEIVFVKMDVTPVKKQNHITQISVIELHNDTILPSSEGVFSGTITVDGIICIGDTSLRK